MKLIKRNIDAPPTPDKRHYVYDDELSGFALSVLPTGRKTFVAHYRVGGGRTGRQRRVTIGVYGKITADDARAKAKDILAKAHLGEDVAEKRDEVRASQTVSQLIDAWSKDGVLINRRTGAARKQVNITNEIALANHHIRRLLGSRTVESLIRGDIQRLRAQIATGETTATRKGRRRGIIKVTGGQGTAVRTVRLFSSILSYAVDCGIIERNPALGVRLPASGRHHRYLSPEEVRALGAVLNRAAASETAATAATIIKLLILTGARRSEIEALRWTEVDFRFGMLRKETSKTGAKIIPLARAALLILEVQRRWTSGNQKWVFPGQKGEGAFDGLGKEWNEVRKLAGISDVRIHDLRHTFASFGAGGGVGLPLIGGILGHTQASTTQRYAHLADKPLRAAANVIGSEIAANLFAV